MKTIDLRPIRESTSEYDEIEKRIIELFRKHVYIPLIQEFSDSSLILRNAKDDLFRAISSGRITFNRGVFSGRFNSAISRDLKKLGARWDRSGKAWRINYKDLPREYQAAVSASESQYTRKILSIDKKLEQIIPEELVEHFSAAKIFDSTLWKVDKQFNQSVHKLVVPAQLTPERRKKIAEEWEQNLKLWIKDFTEKEILRLRKDMKASVFAGNRYESAVSSIKSSYGVTTRKAKFLARQETALLMTTFKKARYVDSGITKYKWKSVVGSPLHPVRPMHKKLNERSVSGEIFDFRKPPVDDPNGSRHNPGENYNCRCVAIPVVTFATR